MPWGRYLQGQSERTNPVRVLVYNHTFFDESFREVGLSPSPECDLVSHFSWRESSRCHLVSLTEIWTCVVPWIPLHPCSCHSLWRRQLSHHENTAATLQRGPRWGAEVTCQPLREPGASCPTDIEEPHWKQLLQPQLSLQITQPWATSWRQPLRLWVRATRLSCSQVPDPQKLWDNTCLF